MVTEVFECIHCGYKKFFCNGKYIFKFIEMKEWLEKMKEYFESSEVKNWLKNVEPYIK